MNNTFRKITKIIVAGDGGIGKTTFLKKFCFNQYDENQELTVGFEIFVKEAYVNDRVEVLQIWDLGGQDRFRFFLKDFLPGLKGAIVAFNVKVIKTFLSLKAWLKMLREYDPHLPIVLIGTKLDLGYNPTINTSVVNKLVEDFGLIKYIEISTKNNYNVSEPFKVLIENIMKTKDSTIEFLPIKVEIN